MTDLNFCDKVWLTGENMGAKEKRYGSFLPNDYFYIKRIKELGISANYLGFYYIIEILDLLLNERMVVRSFSKQVYPKLANKYNKKETTIERNIRNIIDKYWETELKNKLMHLWLKTEKPTCCEFIYILKNYILQEIA